MGRDTTSTLNKSPNLATATTMAPRTPPPVHTSDDANETIYWNSYRRSIIPPIHDEPPSYVQPPAYTEPPAYAERPVEPQAIEAGMVTYEERVHQPLQPQRPQPQRQRQLSRAEQRGCGKDCWPFAGTFCFAMILLAAACVWVVVWLISRYSDGKDSEFPLT